MDPLLQRPLHYLTTSSGMTDIAYVEQGSGDLVVFIHGSLCDLRYWRWQINKLPASTKNVALSLPGYWPYNPSTTAYTFNIEQQLAAVDDLITALRHPSRKVYLVGHSRGAHIAMRYACQHVHRIDGLCLADPAFMVGHDTPPLPVLQQAAHLISSGDDDAALALFIDAVSGANTWRQLTGWFKQLVQENAHTLIAQSREQLPVITNQDLRALANLPVLLISGALSPKRYQQSAELILQALPQAQHCIIKNASHGMNLANPKAFNQAIETFIR